MAKRRAATARRKKGTSVWESLTWEDLTAWAGGRSVSRGRTYQRRGCVKELVVSEDGRLLAFVDGGERYVTSVGGAIGPAGDSPVESTCTCPVGFDGCKHAVAVVAEYLERLAKGEEVPTADPDDPRWDRLEDDDDESDEDAFDDEEPDEWVDSPFRKRGKAEPKKPKGGSRVDWERRIAEHIRAKGREELAELVISLTERYAELREEFQERISLSEGDVERLVAEARKKMREQTAEIGWRNSWSGEGFTPDYSGFRHRLERLVEMGHPDAVVDLGREFIRLGMRQVGQSHDEGETGMAVAECLPVIFTAVTQSSHSGPEQLLFAIDACLEDEWDLIDDAANPILDGDWPAADWSEVAERLQRRLDDLPAEKEGESSFHRNYERDHVSGWLIHALENAGREGELRQVYEAEARNTGSYQRLVRYLIDTGDMDDAIHWAHEGIEKTREKWPGIAAHLAGLLCDVARRNKQWDVVAAHAASDFFKGPSKKTFDELLKAARKTKCQPAVKEAALRFLETGALPFQRRAQGKGKQRTERIAPLPEWPLPVPDYLAFAPTTQASEPHYHVLLDMAIADKKPDDVLHWYEKLTGGRKSTSWGGRWSYGTSYADRVAAAVTKSHPERALEIYTDGLNANLPHADPSAYERVAEYLKKMRPILRALDRETEWTDLVDTLRQEYKRRPLFIEALDRVEGRTIVQSRRRR